MPATAVILYSSTLIMAVSLVFVHFDIFLMLELRLIWKKDRYLCTLNKLDRVV